jgi:hypothetical protein
MAAKKSQVGSLHAQFQQLLKQELQLYLGECADEDGNTIPPMPMAAADKSVYIAWFKMNDCTAEPDSSEYQALRKAFSDVAEVKSEERAKMLTSLLETNDPLQAFTQ